MRQVQQHAHRREPRAEIRVAPTPTRSARASLESVSGIVRTAVSNSPTTSLGANMSANRSRDPLVESAPRKSAFQRGIDRCPARRNAR